MEEDGEILIYTPRSVLDTDLYKLTMQQAIRQHFPEIEALYRFTHRDHNTFFPRKCIDVFQKSIERFRNLSLSLDERNWLEKTCPYFTKEYLDYLADFRFDPDQISIKFLPVPDDVEHGNVQIEAKGLWVETILWEVPMMACLSELYFRIGETDWSYEGQKDNASQKARVMLRAGCAFSEFGTRRRRSFYTQDLVIATLKEESEKLHVQGKFVGTSNVYFAKQYNINPVGTIAHEWFMGIAALNGYESANAQALELWQKTYQDSLLIALTDTFSTKVFFQDFAKDPDRARQWAGLRQDSGNPLEFAPAAKAMYDNIGVDIGTKSIIYSDALTLDKVLQLKKQCDEIGFKCSFGIGTFLTNNFMKKSSNYAETSRALNMVIKLARVDGKECVKISDDPTKNTGDQATVQHVKNLYGLLS
ncbi:hypothetical protein PAXRUDRAFT_147374 [Paxillus rubicundulus Ve08.2h10]|uniref:Nicotinate phosphoribosyltransferase n=1 Tax=Paxillus rubicundulus Ve08.2h10 TaxID=930991 RepID=A0A0D0D6I7_9AGAM|nr:hypothetical protein PAXRUDRAFT_147374 [Paxillus rubicundulus Ve08.2h10]